MSLPIGKRQQPGADDIYPVDPLAKNASPETLAVFGAKNAIGMVWKSSEHRDLVPGVHPMARKL